MYSLSSPGVASRTSATSRSATHGCWRPIMKGPPPGEALSHVVSSVSSAAVNTPNIDRAVSRLSAPPMFLATSACQVTPAAPFRMVPWYQSSAAFTLALDRRSTGYQWSATRRRCRSARYLRIALDSGRANPSASRRHGTWPSGFIARYPGALCSRFPRLTARISTGRPHSCTKYAHAREGCDIMSTYSRLSPEDSGVVGLGGCGRASIATGERPSRAACSRRRTFCSV